MNSDQKLREYRTASADSQELTCPSCGCIGGKCVSHKRGWKVHKCPQCGLFFVAPQPSPGELECIYRRVEGYFATTNDDLRNTSSHQSLWLARVLRTYGISDGRILDIGCATGKLIYHLRGLGWEVCGVEINRDAAQVAQSHSLMVFTQEVENCGFPEAHFDAVYMGNVIEHLRSPKQALMEVHRILRPGGIVIIKTPSSVSGFATSTLLVSRLLRLPWAHSDAPYHLYEFSAESLSYLLQDTGFEMVNLSFGGRKRFAYTVGATGPFDSLKMKMKQGGRYRFHYDLLVKLPQLGAVAVALLPFYLYGVVVDRFKKSGAHLTVVARHVNRTPPCDSAVSMFGPSGL